MIVEFDRRRPFFEGLEGARTTVNYISHLHTNTNTMQCKGPRYWHADNLVANYLLR